MYEAVLVVLWSAIQSINKLYKAVLPPFPQIGVCIFLLAFLLFVVYGFKSGLVQGLKFGVATVLLLTVLSYFVGKMLKLLLIVSA